MEDKSISAVRSLFAEGLALHQAGRLADAEKIYSEVVSLQPDHFDGLHMRGVIFLQCANYTKAVRHIDLALSWNPEDVFALNNRGSALTGMKQFPEALTSYDRALAACPDFPEALSNRGNVLKWLRRFEEALASCDSALAVRPDYAEALSNRGKALTELGRFEEALASFNRALAISVDYTEALYHRGGTLKELKRYDGALASYDRALALRPEYSEALYDRGVTLNELKRYEEALESYNRALAVRPNNARILNSRGNVMLRLSRFEDALACFDHALAVRPNYHQALSNRGFALYELRCFFEALASYDRALAVRPNYDHALSNEALCRLLLGDFDRGWKKYESRWAYEPNPRRRNFVQSMWTGEKIAGKTFLLHAEQGLGDTIQFCRYAPLVAERGARVILRVQAVLRDLMSTLPGVVQISCKGEPIPSFDLHCALLSLPLAFLTKLDTIPSAVPYLHVPSQAVVDWDARLGRRGRPRIGLVWSGSPSNKSDHKRSMRLTSLLSLLDIDASFVSLQYNVRPEDLDVLKIRRDLYHFGDELKGFSEPAALISKLDLVISVDTSVGHLAGALAKPVWVMLPFLPDWRWLLDREDSPWYPTARLFRQDKSRAWDNVIERVRAALYDFVRHSLQASP
jgi:tetratricopeptide (TPR) repeat protein